MQEVKGIIGKISDALGKIPSFIKYAIIGFAIGFIIGLAIFSIQPNLFSLISIGSSSLLQAATFGGITASIGFLIGMAQDLSSIVKSAISDKKSKTTSPLHHELSIQKGPKKSTSKSHHLNKREKNIEYKKTYIPIHNHINNASIKEISEKYLNKSKKTTHKHCKHVLGK